MFDISGCLPRSARVRAPAGPGAPHASHFPRLVTGVAALVAMLAGGSTARADLIVGVDNPFEPLWHIDTDTNVYTPILSGMGAQAIANDPNTHTLYFMTNTVTLWRWAYGAGMAPELIGNTTSDQSSPFLSLTGLGFDHATDRLLATRTLDSSAGPEGLWNVSTVDGHSTLVGAFPGSSALWDVGGFDVDPTTGRAFGISDGNNEGIYEIDLANGNMTFIAPPPISADEEIDIDGLAAGGGKLYLVEDRAAQADGRIFVFDVATGQYEEPLVVPWFFSEIFSGATWISDDETTMIIPEPASMALLGGAALLALRRRRRPEGAATPRRASSRSRLAVAAACLAPTLLAGAAQAQLVMGTSERDEPLYLIDLGSIRPGSFPVPANIADAYALPNTDGLSIWAMTADETNRRLLYLDIAPLFPGADPTTNLWGYSYDTFTHEFLGQIVNRDSGFGQSMQGLALTQSGALYGVYNVGGTPGEGLYRLDIENAVGTGLSRRIFADGEIFARNLPGGESAYDFGSLDYDPVTDQILFYNNDDGAPDGRGVYAFDLTAGDVDFIVSDPNHRRLENDMDGLAAGGGKVYLTTDEPGFIYIYDLVNGGMYQDFLSPIGHENGLFGGAGFAPGLMYLIPEPASAGLLIGAGLLLARRRRL